MQGNHQEYAYEPPRKPKETPKELPWDFQGTDKEISKYCQEIAYELKMTSNINTHEMHKNQQ